MPILAVRNQWYQPHAALYTGGGGGGGGSTTISITDAVASFGSFASLGSFSMSMGSYNATTDDLIFFVGDDQGGNIGTPSIGGVSATQSEKNAGDSKTAVFYIPRGSGVSVSGGNVTVTPGGVGWGNYSMAIGYSTGNASSTPTNHSTSAFTFFSSPNTLSGTVASGGAGVVFWWSESSTSLPISWLPSGWSRVVASEKSTATGNGSQTSCAIQGTPASGTYTLDSQVTHGAYAFIAFA